MDHPAARVSLADLENDPHPALARLRESGPVSWVPALRGWLVTGYAESVMALRDSQTFTVDDPRFSTARVVGPSMLSLDGAAHAHHREPFSDAFRAAAVHSRLGAVTRAEAERLVLAISPRGEAELRRAVAGPLAVAVITEVLGLGADDPATILSWYDSIVAAVQAVPAQAVPAQAGSPSRTRIPNPGFDRLAASLREILAVRSRSSLLAGVTSSLTEDQVISNAAVLMFGGIETTEGMITNAMLHLLANPVALAAVRAEPSLVPVGVEESLRLEPAAAVVDRYATRGIRIGGAQVKAGDQVTISISGANRDPAVFPDPDRFDVRRPNADRHLAFAYGPHFCLGAHLARLEARTAVETLLARLPRLRLDHRYPAAPRGLVFRKPADLRVLWDE